MTIEFIGIRAGHGTTTVALATAAILAQHRPCRIAAHNPADLCALAGVPVALPPSELVHHVDIVDIGEPADVIDAGALPPPPALVGFSIRPADIGPDPSMGLRVGVLRGPDYLGLRTLCAHAAEPLAGVVVLAEADRVLERRDIETVAGRTVLAEVRLAPRLARSLDAGLFANHAPNLAELDELRRWLAATSAKEAPCASVR